MEQRIRVAYDLALNLGKEFQGSHAIADEDMAVIEKYLDLGLITYAKGKKGKMSKLFYFPTLESKEFEGLSMTAWLKIMQVVIAYLGIDSGLSKNSAKEYLSRGWRYGVEPKVLPDSYVSKADKDAEELAIRILQDEVLHA